MPDQEREPNLEEVEFDADQYIDTVRNAYRHGVITYVGKRNEDQQLIAELISDEANQYLDMQASSALSFSGVSVANPHESNQIAADLLDEQDAESYKEMRDSFRQVAVAIAIATERGEGRHDTKGRKINSLIGLSDEDRVKFYDSLFSDFQDLNALRFGASGSGVRETRFVGLPDEETNEYQTIFVDPDKQTPERASGSRLVKGYREEMMGRWLITAAGKLSPSEYMSLRKEFPETDKSDFDRIVSSSRDAEAALEGDEEEL